MITLFFWRSNKTITTNWRNYHTIITFCACTRPCWLISWSRCSWRILLWWRWHWCGWRWRRFWFILALTTNTFFVSFTTFWFSFRITLFFWGSYMTISTTWCYFNFSTLTSRITMLAFFTSIGISFRITFFTFIFINFTITTTTFIRASYTSGINYVVNMLLRWSGTAPTLSHNTSWFTRWLWIIIYICIRFPIIILIIIMILFT